MDIKKLIKNTLKPLKPVVVKTHFYQRYFYAVGIKYNQQKRNVDKKIARRFVYFKKNKIDQYEELFRKIHINIRSDSRFQHWIDEDLYFFNERQVNDSLPPKYDLILKNSIEDLIASNRNCRNK